MLTIELHQGANDLWNAKVILTAGNHPDIFGSGSEHWETGFATREEALRAIGQWIAGTF